MSMPPSNALAGGARQPLARALDPTRPTIRLLRIALTLIAALVSLRLTAESFAIPMWGVDVVIPLRAAGRWLAGGEPYLASGFLTGPGYDNPYLYPPIFLAPYGLLGALPLVPVLVTASVACAIAAYVALRRLGLPPWAVLAVFLWPPVSGAIQGGNVALLMFAAFTGLYWYRSGVRWRPQPRVPGEDARPALVDGLLGGVIPALKISQAHAWVGLLRLRPKAALLGLAVFGGLAIVLLPVLPLRLWFDWVTQSGRAADPTWAVAGSSLTAGAPQVVTVVVALVTMLACLFVPRRRAGLWIGLLTVIGAPTLRMHGVLFAIPAMLEVRREIALLAAILVATYTFEGMWLGLALVTIANILATRFPELLEPVGGPATGATGAPVGAVA